MSTARFLKSAGVGVGDEVVVPAYGDAEAAAAVVMAGARPVFADIDPGSYCLDPDAVAAVLTSRTTAVVAVAAFGHPPDLARIGELGRTHGLLVIGPGDAVAAADEVEQRRSHAAYLRDRLTGVRTPVPNPAHTYDRYVVRVPGNGRPDRDAFAQALRRRGVGCEVPVTTPVHRMPAFRRDVRLPETERAADETLALPVHGSLRRRELQRMVSSCNALGGLLQPAL
ncbi:DegT/DnrJ/EryC1/StrS aminotransferase [Streptomyces sp. SID10853]|uniref:DegT/DnrJ/EryC1/StrS family aminotransferase n=1 Tax=Streptomyces sp. SID10853 TaxID=2706028 RepID=UPI0013BEBCCD|nr:DegT/DnrJ/EryC1/StrS family aminotransferase [Streptomyces sp. SID10853]NDZ82555.1 DegT/DnrJ/EryC1/StrS aminotransferase [Streptomyces sp. SID10853]